MITTVIIGRNEESTILRDCLTSASAELVAVFGRRRVGKTYLIRNIYKDAICFEITGIYNAPLKVQLANFRESLAATTGTKLQLATSQNWIGAFQQLRNYIEEIKVHKLIW